MGGKFGVLKLMAREHLEGRGIWQDEASARGTKAEKVFSEIMTAYLKETNFQTGDQPKDLSGIYGFSEKGHPHGIKPEYVIRNSETRKAIYVEVKRQRAAGNAHERACKFMMPGILASTRTIANQQDNVVPFWWIFTNGIAEDHRYRQEIMHWFQGIEGHVLLWRDFPKYDSVINHFEQHIRPLLL